MCIFPQAFICLYLLLPSSSWLLLWYNISFLHGQNRLVVKPYIFYTTLAYFYKNVNVLIYAMRLCCVSIKLIVLFLLSLACSCDQGFSGNYCVPHDPLPMLLRDDFNSDTTDTTVWKEIYGGSNSHMCGPVVSGKSLTFNKVGLVLGNFFMSYKCLWHHCVCIQEILRHCCVGKYHC